MLLKFEIIWYEQGLVKLLDYEMISILLKHAVYNSMVLRLVNISREKIFNSIIFMFLF